MKKIISGLFVATVLVSSGHGAEEGAMDDEAFALWLIQNEAQQLQENEANLAKISNEECLKKDAEDRAAQEKAAEEAKEAEFQRALEESRIEAISAEIMKKSEEEFAKQKRAYEEEQASLKKIAEERAAHERAANELDDDALFEWLRQNEAQMLQEHEANLAKIAREEEQLRKSAEEAATERARLQKIAQEQAADKRRLPKLSDGDMGATFGASPQHSQWFRDHIGNFHDEGDRWSDEKLQFLFSEGIFQHYFHQFTGFDFANCEIPEYGVPKPYFDFLVMNQIVRKQDPNHTVYIWYKSFGNALKENPILKKLGGAFQLLKVQIEKKESKKKLFENLSQIKKIEICPEDKKIQLLAEIDPLLKDRIIDKDSNLDQKKISKEKFSTIKKLFYLDKEATKEAKFLVEYSYGLPEKGFLNIGNDRAKAKQLVSIYENLDEKGIEDYLGTLVTEILILDRKAIDCQTLIFHWMKTICEAAKYEILKAKKNKYENIEALIPDLVNKEYNFFSYSIYKNIIDTYGKCDHYPR